MAHFTRTWRTTPKLALTAAVLVLTAGRSVSPAQSPAGNLHPGLGRPAAAAIPGVPREILQQLPPGCQQSWTPQPWTAGDADTHPAAATLGWPRPPQTLQGRALETPRPWMTPAAHPQNPAARDPQLPSPDPDNLLDDNLLDDNLLDDNLLDDTNDNLLKNNLSGDHDPLQGDLLLGPAAPPSRGSEQSPHGLPGAGGGLPNPHAAATGAPLGGDQADGPDPHAELLSEHAYPSAQTCAKCHPKHFEEWRTSAHAYATLSPMYQRFEQAMTDLTRGTVGSFCARCHGPVAIQMEYPRAASAIDAPPIVREGITCIACHRVNEAYGRSNGMRRIEPGDIHQPVYGSSGGAGLQEAIAERDALKLKLDPRDKGSGQAIHREARCFEPITRSDFCASCHQVAVHPGIALEVVHAQYRSGPAAAKGIRCQDCHMGAVPGKPEGYEQCQIAELGGKPWGKVRPHANHSFWGPGYSIAHPGVFPINEKAQRWTPREWLAFDYYSRWGEDDFERGPAQTLAFPDAWQHSDDRRDARRILDANLESLQRKRASAVETMEAALAIEGPFFKHPPAAQTDLHFHFRVRNISEGHNLSTGSLGAQPQVWLNVALIGPQGNHLWESGYLDSHGDLADLHSQDVALGHLPRDAQLFNLQTKFLINTLRGTDREVALPLNFNVDQLAFLRPGAVPVSVLNHPPLIRMEAHSIAPLGHRDAVYRVPAHLLQQPGQYRLTVRMRSRPEPIYLMRQVQATPDMIRRMNQGILSMHPRSHPFMVR